MLSRDKGRKAAYLGSSSEDDAAGLGLLTVYYEGEELISNLLNLEQASPGANIRCSDLCSQHEGLLK